MFWKGMPTLSKIYGNEPILKPIPAFHPQWLPAGLLAALDLCYSMIFLSRARAHSQPLREPKLLFKWYRQTRLWWGRACYAPTTSADMWSTAFSMYSVDIWAINTSVDGKLWGRGKWHPCIHSWALFSPGSVDIPVEDHVFCMIVSIYVHWYNSILSPLLFTWVMASLVILGEGNYLRAEDSCSGQRSWCCWVSHLLHLRALRVFKEVDNEPLQISFALRNCQW